MVQQSPPSPKVIFCPQRLPKVKNQAPPPSPPFSSPPLPICKRPTKTSGCLPLNLLLQGQHF